MSFFTKKTAIITGATSGIGQGIAWALNKQGANLILSGRNVGRGQRLEKQLGPSAHFVAGDIKQPRANEALVEAALERFGRLDMLVLSAGQLGIGKLDTLSLEDWQETIATNLNAVFYLLKYAIPEMQKRGEGSVVIIGSVAARHAFPSHPAYSASKGALPALVRQLARDYSPEIRVNLVSPAQVITPLLHNSVKAFDNPDEILEETAQKLPMKRLGLPEDIAHTVLHLLSDQASWITGSNFVVDGGFLAT
ncbi:MAG: SDR family oxidoreductase [Lewinellaceae bacterium]|nr:SDR family oxidoreductase [Phaeodactylibacter sp.]MCB9350487.1 SDR family oxidoreductase [Lewinellaceae bacterium]